MVVTTTALAIGGLALGAVGAGMSYSASRSSARAQEEANRANYEAQQQTIALQKQQEGLRRQAMQLDSARRRREIVRQSIQARSAALTLATGQGVGFSTVLQGAYGQISGRQGTNILGVSQQEEISGKMFDLNADITDVESVRAGKVSAANAGMSSAYRMAALGQGLTSLGGMLMKNTETISKIGTYMSTPSDSSSYFSPTKIGTLY